MTDAPAPGTVLGRLEDIADPGARISDWGDGAIILARRGADVFAYWNECPHANRPLNLPDGRVFLHEQKFLLCPAHGASFVMESGDCAGGPAAGGALKAVAVTVADGEVRAA